MKVEKKFEIGKNVKNVKMSKKKMRKGEIIVV
jgi:hypothetical protein